MTVVLCSTKQKTTQDLLITETTPTSVADGKQFTKFTMESNLAGKSIVTIKKDANGWPISFQMTGAGADPDPLTSMLFMMRQPLWSSKPGSQVWEAAIANPVKAGKTIKVACRLIHPSKGDKTVVLEQKTALFSVMPGMEVQFTSKSVFDSIGGRAKSVTINIDVNAKSIEGQLMEYQEKD